MSFPRARRRDTSHASLQALRTLLLVFPPTLTSCCTRAADLSQRCLSPDPDRRFCAPFLSFACSSLPDIDGALRRRRKRDRTALHLGILHVGEAARVAVVALTALMTVNVYDGTPLVRRRGVVEECRVLGRAATPLLSRACFDLPLQLFFGRLHT